MTQEEILEGNKLIAEFMEGKPEQWYPENKDTGSSGIHYYFSKDKSPTNEKYIGEYALKYHSSLDWLMPVVEKVCSTVIKGNPPFNTDEFVRVEIVPNGYVKISNLRDTPILKNVSVECSLIKTTWLAVVEFIKWYNSNK